MFQFKYDTIIIILYIIMCIPMSIKYIFSLTGNNIFKVSNNFRLSRCVNQNDPKMKH